MTNMISNLETCVGCGAQLPAFDGPIHDYMTSSPACWHIFGQILAAEYSTPSLMGVHRLSVDTYAVQHPGDRSRRAIQSVGLHLARLMVQLKSDITPEYTNTLMRRFTKHKSTLKALTPPAAFRMTVADISPHIGTENHANIVRKWAHATWQDWRHAHDYIRNWAEL